MLALGRSIIVCDEHHGTKRGETPRFVGWANIAHPTL